MFGQLEELLCVDDATEVVEGVLPGRLLEVVAAVGVGKPPDAQTIAGVQLPHQKLTAGIPDALHLK